MAARPMNVAPPPASESVAFHARTGDEVLAALGSRLQGLNEAEAQARREQVGPNRLTERPGRGALLRFLLQFHNVLIYVLLTAAAVTALLRHWVDTGVILGVVLINAIVGFIQEGKAERALAAIRRMLSLKATVLRGGLRRVIAAEQLVPGDIVVVQSGDRLPADVRLLRVKNLRIDEASLTGESMPVEKGIEPVDRSATLGDRSGMAYSGTLVTYGQGRGVVVATGDRTELGQISGLIAGVERIETPLLRAIRVFSLWLSGAILLLASATFAFGTLWHGNPVSEMFMAAVGLAVAAIPEGLPAIMTITLAIGVQRMARRNAIVRVLPVVEALGSVTCICSDKTGTLTRNEMTVQAILLGDREVEVDGVGYEPHGALRESGVEVDPAMDSALRELLLGGLLCNDATLVERNGTWSIDGDPTEGALVVAARKAGFDPHLEAERRPRTDVIPFESENRFMATLHHDHAGHGYIYIKGAPERLLEMCGRERVGEADQPLRRGYWEQRIHALGGHGQRVLALAFRPTVAEHRDLRDTDIADNLIWLGAFGMVDPPREEAIAAVAACHRAGIRVKMITGDHAQTAVAIATRLAIGDGRRVITGAELEDLDDSALYGLARDVDVYARVSPEHKLRLVTALQKRGEVVAMTGDGVNDAPALKRADVGVAMGVTGTEAAKEAAEMVLADDNFASIASAVEEGRTVYDNLRKTILFILPTSGGEAFVLVIAIVFGLTLPLLPVQILWVNMITAVTLSLALAFEPTETGTMLRPPRHPRAPLFSGYFLWRTLIVSAILATGTLGVFLWEVNRGVSLELARTAAVNTLVMFEAFYLFNSRSLLDPVWPHRAAIGNRYIPLMVVLVVGFQLLYTYLPVMQTLFQSAPLELPTWGLVVAVGSTVYVIVELEKTIVRALGRRHPASRSMRWM